MFDLSGKVAIITGGSRGIGRAIGEALAAQGAHVVLGYASGEAAAHAAVEAIVSAGGKAEAARLDVSDTPATEQSIAEIGKRLGRLDILVANAGISLDGLLLRLSEDDFDKTLAVNLKGAVSSARAAVKIMMRAKTGRVVFISSVVGEMGNAGQTAYSASKAALLGVTKSIAREYASRNVTVNAVTPGFIDTDMTASLSDAQKAGISAAVPLGRTGTAREVAAAVVYLASDEAAYVTGHALRVNGGMYM
jgi:3-oxoacyl-[acyl-carrier protein] reductase